MNNIINTIVGNTAVTAVFKIIWAMQEGCYLYIPAADDVVKLRFFDNKGKTIVEKECNIDNNEIIIEFPEGLSEGYYDYELNLYMSGNELPRTLTSGKFHVGRR